MGLVPVEHARRFGANRDMSKTCLWEQDGGQKCQPTDTVFCRPCLETFWTDGSVPRPAEADGPGAS